MDWLYAVAQYAVFCLASIYWAFAVTDLFSRYIRLTLTMSTSGQPVTRHLGRTRLAPAPAPVILTASNLPRMIRVNGKVVYRAADQKAQQVRNRGGVLFRS